MKGFIMVMDYGQGTLINLLRFTSILLILCFFALLALEPTAQEVTPVISSVAWSPDGSMIAVSSGEVGCEDYTGSFPIPIYSTSTGQVIKTLAGMNCTATWLHWSSDGSRLLGARDPDSLIYIWDFASRELLREFPTNTQGISMALWQPNSNTIAGSFIGNSILFWDANTGQRMDYSLSGTTFDWSPDGSQIVRGSLNHNIAKITDVSTREDVRQLSEAPDIIYSLDWSANGSLIAAVSGRENVVVWDATTGQILFSFVVSELSDATLSPDSQMLATSSYDGTIRVWNTNTGNLLETYAGLGELLTVVWNPDGSQLAYSDSDNKLKIVNAPRSITCNVTVTPNTASALLSAITSANATPEPDTICLEAGIYTLDAPITSEIMLVGLGAGAEISGALQVSGAGLLTLRNVAVTP